MKTFTAVLGLNELHFKGGCFAKHEDATSFHWMLFRAWHVTTICPIFKMLIQKPNVLKGKKHKERDQSLFLQVIQ